MFSPVLLLAPLLYATTPAPATRVELVFGGDVIPHGELKKAAQAHALSAPPEVKGEPPRSLNNEGWDHVFEPIAGELRAVDVAVVNLETPVTDNKKAVTRQFLFNAPSAMVRALAAAGVKLVSTANNHARDQNLPGMVETLRHLDAAGIQHVGTGVSLSPAWEPVVMDVKGMRLGFLSFTRWMNGFTNPEDLEGPHVAYVPYKVEDQEREVSVEQLVEQVRLAAGQCDVLFVMVHWGAEYAEQPHPEDQQLARALIDAGAGAVIGHHPHVLQPLEQYTTPEGRKALIAYSLGNLVANQGRFYTYKPGGPGKDGDVRDSMLLRVAWVRREAGGPVELDAVSALPVWIENNALTRKRKELRNIQPLLLDREVEAVVGRVAQLDAQPLPEGRKAKAAKAAAKVERTALERRLAMQKLRRERILKMLPEGVTVATPTPRTPEAPAGGVAVQGAP
ncbi:CapA family protein [Hyalangium rubrum]|uniref:CapA family protein n=1 Tax=Hyalangium rubrum TaxID=3103134 RepID=A0ABU5GZ35_9BACT|nr:CapA family protein [Hyalangium sp. s54d21]MDY7226463.1 CapA family protein [Hyalangium sp. s54d21]